MDYTIRGDFLPIVDVQLNQGESVFSESGGMAWMTPNIDMQTSTRGGLLKGVGRMSIASGRLVKSYYIVTDENNTPGIAPHSSGNKTIINVCSDTKSSELLCTGIKIIKSNKSTPAKPTNVSVQANSEYA